MNKCYNFKIIKNNENLFNIDATYVLTLTNSQRKKQYTEQLKKYKFSKKIYIQYNKGFKNCKKNLNNTVINNVQSDIFHAFLNIFKHAKNNNYNSILILEDDFLVSEKINKNDIDNINNIIPQLNKKNTILRLGSFPWVTSFYLKNPKFLNLHLGNGAHAIIYPKNIINNILTDSKKIKNGIVEFDLFIHRYKQLLYKKSIISQIITETDSYKSWGISNIIIKNFTKLGMIIFKKLKLNKKPEPGSRILYNYSLITGILIQIIIIFIAINMFKLLI